MSKLYGVWPDRRVHGPLAHSGSARVGVCMCGVFVCVCVGGGGSDLDPLYLRMCAYSVVSTRWSPMDCVQCTELIVIVFYF